MAFGRTAEFAEKYLKQGTKMVVSGRIQTGSYTNRDGVKVYTTEVVIEEQDFAESKAAAAQNSNMGVPQPSAPQPSAAASDGLMNSRWLLSIHPEGGYTLAGFPNYRVLPVRKFHNKVCG